jgi:hypothetical protein
MQYPAERHILFNWWCKWNIENCIGMCCRTNKRNDCCSASDTFLWVADLGSKSCLLVLFSANLGVGLYLLCASIFMSLTFIGWISLVLLFQTQAWSVQAGSVYPFSFANSTLYRTVQRYSYSTRKELHQQACKQSIPCGVALSLSEMQWQRQITQCFLWV